jgi:alpha-1,2-mannosyltransferase
MVPLALLPFGAAAALFGVASVAAFALTVAWGATQWFPGAGHRRRVALAVVAGLHPPVYGSVAMGQANLVLLPLLAYGAALAVAGTTAAGRFRGGLAAGLAAVVKLVPAVWIVPLALGRRFGATAGIAVAAGVAMVVAIVLVPWGVAGSGGLASLLEADPFYTNQSINGFVSRLVEP